MENIKLAAQLLSIVSFLFYGSSCFFSKKMMIEFNRYQLSGYRKLTGILQLLGSIGLAAGLVINEFTTISSLGLGVLMFLGVIVRIRIQDSIQQASPALFFCILNLFIFWKSLF